MFMDVPANGCVICSPCVRRTTGAALPGQNSCRKWPTKATYTIVKH